MKPPVGMTMTYRGTDGDTVTYDITITPTYCPCGWRCHTTPYPCSLSCLTHRLPGSLARDGNRG